MRKRERETREEARNDAVQEPLSCGGPSRPRGQYTTAITLALALRFLSFSGVSWSLSFSLSFSLERMNGFLIFFHSRPVSFHITTEEEEEEEEQQQEDAVLTVC
jgi:hypothetical protein